MEGGALEEKNLMFSLFKIKIGWVGWLVEFSHSPQVFWGVSEMCPF